MKANLKISLIKMFHSLHSRLPSPDFVVKRYFQLSSIFKNKNVENLMIYYIPAFPPNRNIILISYHKKTRMENLNVTK